mgnify:CR=1 FL=1
MGPLSFFSIVLVSLIISYGLKLWFTRLQKFDAINHRSVHQTKATKTGGMAVFLTLFIFSIYYYLNSNEIFDFSLLIPLGIMFMVGVYDDFYNADFKLKFFLFLILPFAQPAKKNDRYCFHWLITNIILCLSLYFKGLTIKLSQVTD